MRTFFKFVFTVFLLVQTSIFSQSTAITIDGVFDDWNSSLTTYTDLPETLSGIDLLSIQVTNDENFLYIKIKTDEEFDLTDTTIPQNLVLFIDTDNDPNTGFNAQTGYGTELGILFNEFFAHYNVTPYSQIGFSSFSMRIAPTVTSDEFEIAIKRNAIPDGINPLFTSETIRILLRNDANFDSIPESNDVFFYTFDQTPITPITLTEINKETTNLIRIVAYNTLFSGLLDSNRVAHFENIITALNPDIVGFVESYNTSTTYVKSLFDQWLPLDNDEGWYVLKHGNGGEVAVSRWPFIFSWDHLTRQFPVLIDLPNTYNSDLLFTVSHLSCCGADNNRQDQVDQYAAFILDAKTNGGLITLVENTPFVYAGDLNLVGFSQQLTTLITGDIQNTATYGNGGALDWDNTDVTDQNSRQSDIRMAYTWRDDNSLFPPGKLDFMLFSDAVISAEKSFVLQTEVMTSERLSQYNLTVFDTSDASDHFPVITDFRLNQTASLPNTNLATISIYPNPTNKKITIEFNDLQYYDVKLFNTLGKLVIAQQHISKTTNIDVSNISAGIYFISVTNKNGAVTWKKIIKN